MKTEITETRGLMTIYRETTKCFHCGKEMTVTMIEETHEAFRNGAAEIWCSKCAIAKRQIPKRALKKVPNGFYMVVLYKPKENHKGTRPQDYHNYLQSAHWKIVRQETIDRAGGRCQLCNKPGTLHVHHRTYENIGNEQPSDLIALCAHCHAKFHDKLD